MSTDFEDIVFILNNRSEIWNEMEQSTNGLKSYLVKAFASLLTFDYCYEWVSSHLDYHEQKRANLIIGGINAFVEGKNAA
jgi:hypothetical protein